MTHVKQSLVLACLVANLTGFAALAQPAATSTAEVQAPSSAPAAGTALPRNEVADALRKGGYVVYFRHTATDFSKNDASMKSYADCASQRLLSDVGRRTGREIGRQVARLALPAGEAFASPLCRTMETGTLILKNVQPKNELREGEGGDYPGLRALLAAPVAARGNRWLFGHGTPFRAVAGAPHLAEGEAAVIRPEGTHWTVVARLQPGDWALLK